MLGRIITVMNVLVAFIASVFGALTATAAVAPSQSVPDRLDLSTAISFALENNFSIRQARERIRAQEGVVTTVTAAALPSVSAAGSYQHSDVQSIVSGSSGVPLFVPAGPSWRMTLTASQALFAGGGIRASIRSADLALEAAILDLQTTVNDTLLEVRTRFYNVLLAREQVKVQEQNLDLLQNQLHYATVRAQVGTTTDFERLRAEVAVANAQVPLIRARNDLRLAVEEMRRVLGFTNREPEALRKVPEFDGSLEFQPETFDLGAAFSSAQENRPEIKRLAKLIAAGEEGVTVARSRYYPTLAVSGGGELRKGATSSFGDSIKGLRAGVQSQLQVSRATSGAVAQAVSQAEQLKLTASETKLAIEVEVRRAFSALQQATELASAMQKTVGQAEEAVRLATGRFEAGTATQLDVLQAQVELTNARTSQLRANHDYNVALAQLRKATGASEVEYTAATVSTKSPVP